MSRFFEDNSSLLLSCRSTTTTVIVAVVGGVVFFVFLHPKRETYRFSMGHVKWCVSLFFGFFVWESPQKAVLVFFFPNLRHQVFRGGGSLGASIVRQPLGLKMRSPRIVLIYINLMKLKKKSEENFASLLRKF